MALDLKTCRSIKTIIRT